MKTIYKYILLLTDRQQILNPGRGPILSAANQDGTLCVWAEAEPGEPETPHEIYIHGTGRPLKVPPAARFIGTVLMPPFVMHVWAESIA